MYTQFVYIRIDIPLLYNQADKEQEVDIWAPLTARARVSQYIDGVAYREGCVCNDICTPPCKSTHCVCTAKVRHGEGRV
jgi:hypothetical protein